MRRAAGAPCNQSHLPPYVWADLGECQRGNVGLGDLRRGGRPDGDLHRQGLLRTGRLARTARRHARGPRLGQPPWAEQQQGLAPTGRATRLMDLAPPPPAPTSAGIAGPRGPGQPPAQQGPCAEQAGLCGGSPRRSRASPPAPPPHTHTHIPHTTHHTPPPCDGQPPASAGCCVAVQASRSGSRAQALSPPAGTAPSQARRRGASLPPWPAACGGGWDGACTARLACALSKGDKLNMARLAMQRRGSAGVWCLDGPGCHRLHTRRRHLAAGHHVQRRCAAGQPRHACARLAHNRASSAASSGGVGGRRKPAASIDRNLAAMSTAWDPAWPEWSRQRGRGGMGVWPGTHEVCLAPQCQHNPEMAIHAGSAAWRSVPWRQRGRASRCAAGRLHMH